MPRTNLRDDRYPEKTQAMMIRPPAVLLESWSNHRSLKLRHWVSFAQHGTASLGRFADQNDVVIPDHSVSGEHALLIHNNGEFWLHDRESSNGSFIRLCAPLRLAFGESLHLKMGKSLLCLQAKRSRWSRIRMRLVSILYPLNSEVCVSSSTAVAFVRFNRISFAPMTNVRTIRCLILMSSSLSPTRMALGQHSQHHQQDNPRK